MYVRRYNTPPVGPPSETPAEPPAPPPEAPVQPAPEKPPIPSFGRILYTLSGPEKEAAPRSAAAAPPYRRAGRPCRSQPRCSPPPKNPLKALTDRLSGLCGGDVEWLPLALAAGIWLLSRDKENNEDLPLILALLLIAL